uniref:Uncharacterized protein n=1 Tax=Arundo donax TaxID=35708 RepID=A0A0A9B3H0_ARUDO
MVAVGRVLLQLHVPGFHQDISFSCRVWP